eukprot:scaffold282979_cov32-Tisochrysis_lutea.AAC.5
MGSFGAGSGIRGGGGGGGKGGSADRIVVGNGPDGGGGSDGKGGWVPLSTTGMKSSCNIAGSFPT